MLGRCCGRVFAWGAALPGGRSLGRLGDEDVIEGAVGAGFAEGGVDAALAEDEADGLAFLRLAGLDDGAGLLIEDEGVTAIERGLGTEGAEAGGELGEMFPAARQFPSRVMGGELGLEEAQGVLAGLQGLLGGGLEILAQVVETLGPLPDDTAWLAQGVAGGEAGEVAAVIAEDLSGSAFEPGAEGGDFVAPLGPVAGEKLGGSAGGGRAQIGDKVGDGEVGLMSHGGDGGHAARGQGAGDDFFVEGPEVFEAAATAGDDEEIDLLPGAEGGDGFGDFLRGAGALDADAPNEDADAGGTALEDAEHVLQHGALQGCDHADDFREDGQGALAVEVEEVLSGEAAFEFLEALLEAALAARADFGDLNLVLAARFVDGDGATDEHGLAILQGKADPAGLALEHDGGEGGGGVLEGEVEMARAGGAEVGDLARDPDFAEVFLEQVADRGSQVGDRERVLRRDARGFDFKTEGRLVDGSGEGASAFHLKLKQHGVGAEFLAFHAGEEAEAEGRAFVGPSG